METTWVDDSIVEKFISLTCPIYIYFKLRRIKSSLRACVFNTYRSRDIMAHINSTRLEELRDEFRIQSVEKNWKFFFKTLSSERRTDSGTVPTSNQRVAKFSNVDTVYLFFFPLDRTWTGRERGRNFSRSRLDRVQHSLVDHVSTTLSLPLIKGGSFRVLITFLHYSIRIFFFFNTLPVYRRRTSRWNNKFVEKPGQRSTLIKFHYGYLYIRTYVIEFDSIICIFILF